MNFRNSETLNLSGVQVQYTTATPNNTTSWFFQGRDGSDIDWTVYSNGTTSTSSDERLKNNITDTSINGMDILNSIKVRDWEWKQDNKSETGFVSQELKEIYPRAVTGEEDETEERDGKIVPKYMGVSKEQLIPVLVKAYQELSDKLDTANAKIEALENA